MGEHNNAMCGYFARAENCADFWNGILFQGRQEIRPEELEYSDKEYYGIIKNTMPVRKLAYDAQEYQRQMQKVIGQNRVEAARLAEEAKMTAKPMPNKYWRNSGEFLYGLHKGDKIPPLITVALYCGTEKYDGCNDLSDMLNSKYIDTEYGKWISGYPLHVIVLQDLQEEYFKTGLRELIGVMKRSSDSEALLEYCNENRERFEKLDDFTIETIGVMIGNQNLIQFKQERGGLDMCKAFEMVKEEGRLEGKIEGEERYAKLTRELYIRERMADILQAATNIEYRNRLYQEFRI
uniref:hypothetical protein n=1 Tax=Acetatifactor sp. TaxID=1872090 RepID=UPI004057014C